MNVCHFVVVVVVCEGGLIVKPGVCNMQHVTSLSFLLLAYSNYLSHANHVVPCGSMSATPALLKHIAKRQVGVYIYIDIISTSLVPIYLILLIRKVFAMFQTNA